VKYLLRLAAAMALFTAPASMLAAYAAEPPATAAASQFQGQGATSVFPTASWAQADPATQGFSQAGIESALAYAKQEGSTAGMIVRNGWVVAQWGDISRKSNLYSVRKSFMSALVGIAVARGLLRLDDTLGKLGIDDEPPSLSPAEKEATLRMLLEARSGVYHASVYETAGMKASKPPRYSHAPGTFWYYNNWDFNTVGAIYEQATGKRIFEALKTEIADPIGMQDYLPSDGRYVSGEPSTRYPAYPIRMSTRDLARFALLYLHDGRWRGRQVVPAAWVAESTRPDSNNATGGYGYMWWTSVPASGERPRGAKLLRPAFWADGHLGQYAVVVPSLQLVIVSRVDSRLTSKHMSRRKMEGLVWRVESAAQATGIGPQP
jgi:CubicO group peptidase (beta-lactamase class C family)